jgi:uncharacterized protein YydD (DUF2326 family)
MIKLSRIYSNSEKLFPEIVFRNGLNVIFASVTKNLEDKSSHSLGKTLLLDLIDYCLLKGIRKGFFLKKEVFSDFIFYLEIKVEKGRYITIKRVVNGKISLAVSDKPISYNKITSIDWKYDLLSFKAGKEYLNKLINPEVVNSIGFQYRNGLRYCLRKQTQYEDTFKVNRSRERDSNWKPYLAGILGIEPNVVLKKYEANRKVDGIKIAVKQISDLPEGSSQYLEAEISQITNSVTRMKSEVDKFDFRRSDENVSKELIEDISKSVTNHIQSIYVIDEKISAINTSLLTKFNFDLEKVLELFEDVQIYFPEKLSHPYEELIQLNKEMSTGRKKRLKASKIRLQDERVELNEALGLYRKKQQELTSILLQKDAFEKYKQLQSRLTAQETRSAVLKERLNKLDIVTQLEDKLVEAETDKKNAAKKLELATRLSSNTLLKNTISIFSELVEDILSIPAFFYSNTNKDGNIEFKIGLEDQTSINDGFSYTRTLSAIFDITLLLLYKDQDFYRFSYHDGLLESLDDRVKLKIINTWRKLSEENNLQLIISVLDSDLPIAEEEKRYFKDKEVVRELHDRGDSGRLFRMGAF